MELWFKILQSNLTPYLGLIFSLLVLITHFTSWRKNKRVNAFMASIPGPPPVPFLGSAYIFLENRSESLYNNLRAHLLKYPRIFGVWVLNAPYIITGDRKILNAIANSENVQKMSDYKRFKEISQGILTSNGPEWRQIRRTISPSFRSDVLASFGPGYSHHTNIFLEKLREYAKNGDIVDIITPVHMCTLDFVCDNLMGIRKDVQKKNMSFYSTGLITASEMVFERLFSFVQWSDWLYYLMGKQKKLDTASAGMHALAREIVKQRLEQRQNMDSSNGPAKRQNTFFEILLDNLDSGCLSLERVIEETNDMLLAGSITSGIANAWVLKILAMRADIQEKAYQEIIETCGRREITLEDISKLEYLSMVIKETLRHFGVPFIGRYITKDVQVDDETTIPAGVSVLMVLFDLHQNPELWEKPSEFYPEHFSPENEAIRPKGSFMPFVNGPRNCIGNKYAMQSMKFLLANTILNFEFSSDETLPADLKTAEYKLAFLLMPKNGFNVRVKNRWETPHP